MATGLSLFCDSCVSGHCHVADLKDSIFTEQVQNSNKMLTEQLEILRTQLVEETANSDSLREDAKFLDDQLEQSGSAYNSLSTVRLSV